MRAVTPSRRARDDAERFERIYAQHFERVAAYLLARADRDVAADALAATFEVTWRRIAEVPDESLPWLLGVARRVLANARRSRTRQAALVDRMAAATSETLPGGEESGHAEALAAALSRLTGSQQEALLLVAWDGLSEREAALALGCSRAAFAARLHRARVRVRAAMGEAQAPASEGRPGPGLVANSIEEAV
jgi:RNA polymerase sigma-70 factor, ECF subfamily